MEKFPIEIIQKILFFVYKISLVYNENFLEKTLVCRKFYTAIYNDFFIKQILLLHQNNVNIKYNFFFNKINKQLSNKLILNKIYSILYKKFFNISIIKKSHLTYFLADRYTFRGYINKIEFYELTNNFPIKLDTFCVKLNDISRYFINCSIFINKDLYLSIKIFYYNNKTLKYKEYLIHKIKNPYEFPIFMFVIYGNTILTFKSLEEI